jgi:hypothetical protein
MNRPAQEVWYRRGLRFECRACGNCCTGTPGYVFVTQEEITKIAEHIGRKGKGLTKKHLRQVGSRQSLTEDKETGDCCFLLRGKGDKRTCAIYPVRPLQCRTWPFWKSNLLSPEHWADEAAGCPGMNRGRHFTLDEIETRRKARRWKDVPE